MDGNLDHKPGSPPLPQAHAPLPGPSRYRGDVATQPAWWKTAVVYQVYPRSFADGNGDGVGDLAGLRAQLDHCEWLGVNALWLSPIFRSPMADYGYDVADYCDVDPLFGSLDDLDALIADCHRRDIKLLLDWVPNHTSIEHPWFRESRSDRTNARRDWYVWRDPAPDGGPPNNWRAAFDRTSPAWTWDARTEQYYLHLFLPEQPDLNWEHPEVQEAMLDTLRFWLDRGVDGFRMDVIHLLGKDLTLDDPPAAVEHGIPHVVYNDQPATHGHLRAIRRLLDGYPGDRVSVGEVYLLDEAAMAAYYGDDDELHLSFNFPFLWAPFEAQTLRSRIETTLSHLEPRGAWPTWVLSNHDVPRHRDRYGGTESAARAAAVLLLTLPGTPFLYQGEELGLGDAVVPPDRVLDPGGRDGCRAPIPWSAAPGHGWPDDPWLPFPPEAGSRSVETQRADPDSILHLYRELLAVRRAHPALTIGELEWIDGPDGVLAYRRRSADESVTVVINTTSEALSNPVAGAQLLVASDRSLAGSLAPTLLGTHAAMVAVDPQV
jgi:alpha-glucosidase